MLENGATRHDRLGVCEDQSVITINSRYYFAAVIDWKAHFRITPTNTICLTVYSRKKEKLDQLFEITRVGSVEQFEIGYRYIVFGVQCKLLLLKMIRYLKISRDRVTLLLEFDRDKEKLTVEQIIGIKRQLRLLRK
jgi:hypothetical protein